jgi:RNA recognition motif-containing protein
MRDRVEVKTGAIQRYWSIFVLTFIFTNETQTSNVFVANLPPHVTEQSLGNFFARVGPVGSVGVYISRNLSFTYW